MKKHLIIILGFLLVAGAVSSATICFPFQGCTGTGSVPNYGDVLVGTSGGIYQPVATTTLGIGGSPFAWTPTSYGVATSTTLGFLNGFLSTASSTIVGNATTTGRQAGGYFAATDTTASSTLPKLQATTGRLDSWLEVAGQFISTLTTGTSPFSVLSTTLVTNLNADLLDGAHVGTSGATVPLLNAANTWSVDQTHSANIVLQDNKQIELGTGSQGAGDARLYHDATDLILDLNAGPSKVFDHFRVKRDIVMSAEVEGTRHSLIYTHAAGARLFAGSTLYLKFGEVQTSSAKAPAMPRAGSIVSVSVQYDVTATDGGSSLFLQVIRNGSTVWNNLISNSVASNKEDSFTQARDTDTFLAEGNLTVALNAQGSLFTDITVNDIMVILDVYYDS